MTNDTDAKGPRGNPINQKAPKFEDRRTKRNRDRTTKERRAIEEQEDE